jgi:hypothetical protein
VALLCFALAVITTVGCGSDSERAPADTGASAEKLAQARQEGAQDARQSQQVKQLKSEVRELKKSNQKPPPALSSTTTVEATTTAPSTGSSGWPGGSGYTAVLASVGSQSEAESIQSRATAEGLDAGVLYSSEFSSLRPGYWVVFSGQFLSQPDASARAERAKSLGYSDAYPRFVAP